MKECTKCGQVQDEEEFESNRPYDRKRGITTAHCRTCRMSSNNYKRHWYATTEKRRTMDPLT